MVAPAGKEQTGGKEKHITSVLAREPIPESYFGKGQASSVVKHLQMLLCAPSAGAAGQGCSSTRDVVSGGAGSCPWGEGTPGSPFTAWDVSGGKGISSTALQPPITVSLCSAGIDGGTTGDMGYPAGDRDVVASQGDWQGQGNRNLAVAMVTT